MGDKGAEHLADALRNDTVGLIFSLSRQSTQIFFFTQILNTLDRGDNQIGNRGAQHLADALRNNKVSLILSSSIQ